MWTEWSVEAGKMLKDLKILVTKNKGGLLSYWAQQSLSSTGIRKETVPLEFSPDSEQFIEPLDTDKPITNSNARPSTSTAATTSEVYVAPVQTQIQKKNWIG